MQAPLVTRQRHPRVNDRDENNDETCGFNTRTPVHHHEQGIHGEKNNRRDNAVADEAVTLNREL